MININTFIKRLIEIKTLWEILRVIMKDSRQYIFIEDTTMVLNHWQTISGAYIYGSIILYLQIFNILNVYTDYFVTSVGPL